MRKEAFQELIWEKGRELYRPMPWRENTDPYWILVSELMLQQTQVDRVIPKFDAFIARFPDVQALAQAPLGEVLVLWSGLGYNRRAKFLHSAAHMIVTDFGGQLPAAVQELQKLPGVGVNTAGAIATYGFNRVAPFIETNVRTVYFQHYFEDDDTVTDAQIREAVIETIDHEHPREWYWALMDYGSWLKRNGRGSNRRSAHYVKQAPLKGSLREVRGMIMKQLAHTSAVERTIVQQHMPNDDRFTRALAGLVRDGLVIEEDSKLKLP